MNNNVVIHIKTSRAPWLRFGTHQEKLCGTLTLCADPREFLRWR